MGNSEVSINLLCTFIFPISWLPRHLEKKFCTIFNSLDQAKFKIAKCSFHDKNWWIDIQESHFVLDDD